MKKQIIFITILFLMILPFTKSYVYEVETNKMNYKEGTNVQEQLPGTYTSKDGKTITVATDGTTKYLDTYTLTVTQAATGNVLSGKVGTNNKAATFYQLNDHIIVSGVTVNYTYNSATEYLYDYTVFSLEKTPEPSTTGTIEIWRENQKINTYNTLQDAIEAATENDTIKLTKDYTATEGAYINKNITIDGNNKTIDTSKWLNSLFVIDKNIEVNIMNLNITGGATGFKVNYDAVTFNNSTIPLVADSATNDPKNNMSVIFNKSNLKITNSKISNIYGTTGPALNHIEGNLTLENSDFNHNRGSSGGAIYLGRAFYTGETDYSSQTTLINNCKFNDNYASNGGALFLRNSKTLKITDTEFNKNTVTGGKGGAIYIYRDKPSGYNSTAEKLGLDYMMVDIDNSLFYGNWVGDDGYAIQSFDGQLTIKKTKFIENVGTHPSSAIGTVSSQISRNNQRSVNTIEECIFKDNKGVAAVLGDHSSKADYQISKTTFTGNDGKYSILFYSSHSTITDSIFTGEKNRFAQIYLISYESTHKTPNLTITDTVFENNTTPTNILVSKASGKMTLPDFTLNINGENTANVELWYGSNLNVDGKLNGYINVDNTITNEDITITENSTITEGLNYHENEVRVQLVFKKNDNDTIIHYIYLEPNRVYTEKELYEMHKIGDPNGKITYYTDETHTTPWTYSVTASVKVYGKIEEHTHASNGTLVLKDNMIYDQCECGYLFNKLSLSVPTENTYNGKEIPIEVTNNINAKNYKIVYYVKENDNWKELSSTPIKEGTYKAVLTYNDMTIEQEYNIEPKNPNTAVNIGILSFLLVSLFISIICFNKFKALKVKRYNN